MLSGKKLDSRLKSVFIQVLTLVICLTAFSLVFIQNFSDPLIGSGDTEYWEFTGYYLSKNIQFTPFPQLNLFNDQAFYPYGVNQVFQPWGLERDYFYAILSSMFGLGGWIQIYYFLSVLVTAVGTYLLLLKEYRSARAGGAGLLISFFSFYTLHKYPNHLSYATVHWTVLSFIVDFLIVKRVVLKQSVSLRLMLIRSCLLVLALSQELGYIAGFALMSFAVSIIYIALTILYRRLKFRYSLHQATQNLWQQCKVDFARSRFTCLALLVLLGITSYLYIPLVLQIAKAAKSFTSARSEPLPYWTSPYRLLIPYLPGFNPGQLFEQVFRDIPEGFGAGSPGWFLLIIGTLGLWQSRKKITIFVPLILIFLLCLFYFPKNFATLRIFPWLSFARVPGRVSVLYPIILTIFALELHFNQLKLRQKRFVAALLVCLACVEISTAYSLKTLSYRPATIDQSLFTYIETVRNQPGEAILDWPFCVTGGNGTGALQGLCPYYPALDTAFSLRRFHYKKVVGQYYGRLYVSQLKSFLDAGWQNLFQPNSSSLFEATRQARCFNTEEWSFFTKFYQLNDFAGINLYPDLLSSNCAEEFYTRFGKPAVETRLPNKVRLQFIPKPSALRKDINPALGKTVRLQQKSNFNAFSYEIKAIEAPRSLSRSNRYKLPVVVKNTSDEVWRSDGSQPVYFSYHWLNSDGKIEIFNGERTSFPEAVAPSESIALNASINPPSRTGQFVLQLTLVQESVAWFERRGAKPLNISVVIEQ